MSQLFKYQSHEVRTVAENNQIWFIARDVCAALGLRLSGHTLDAIPQGWKGLVSYATPSSGKRGGGKQSLRAITEPAVYKLAFRSNKPEADAFTNWVASEVLPAIRKTGGYGRPKTKPVQAAPLPQVRVAVVSQSCNKELRTAADIAEAIRLVESIRERVRREHRPREYRCGDSRAEARYELQWDMFRACNSSLAAAAAALCASAEVSGWA